jgi:hypothetical protein
MKQNPTGKFISWQSGSHSADICPEILIFYSISSTTSLGERENHSRTGKAQTPHGFYFIRNPRWLNKASRLAKRTGISTQRLTQQIERFSYSLQVFRRRDLCPVHRDWIYQDQGCGRRNAEDTSITVLLEVQPSSPRVGLGRGKRKEKKR